MPVLVSFPPTRPIRPNRQISDLRFTLTDPPKRDGCQGESKSEIGRFGLFVKIGGDMGSTLGI